MTDSPMDRDRTQPGTRLLIAFNRHHADATGIVGDVVRVEPGAGFGGIDLVVVRYQRPLDGEVCERPFGAANLEPGEHHDLLARARRHEQQAASMRRMAEEAGRSARDER